MRNWIPDLNKFSLATPPDYFLRRLWDFDASLVVIPSQQQPIYRLAQRRKVELPEKLRQDPLFNESDTKMLASYGLVPVTAIFPTIRWDDPANFEELANRCVWRLGGAAAVEKLLDEQEQRRTIEKAARTEEHLSSLGKDAWGLYNKKIGTRTHMWSPTIKRMGATPEPKAPSFVIKQASA